MQILEDAGVVTEDDVFGYVTSPIRVSSDVDGFNFKSGSLVVRFLRRIVDLDDEGKAPINR